MIRMILISLLIFGCLEPVSAKKKSLKKYAKSLKGEYFELIVPVVKLSYSLGKDQHTTNVYEDSTIIYRIKTNKLVEGEGKSFGEKLGSAMAKSILEGSNEIVNTDPQEFIKQVREVTKRYSGQILPAGSKVKIRKVNLKSDMATVYIRTISDLKSRIYLKFKTKKYKKEDLQHFFGIVLKEPD